MITIEDMKKAAKESISMAEFLRAIGKKPFSGNYQTYKRKLADNDIDTSHWLGKKAGYLKLLDHNLKNVRSFEEILVKNSTYTNTSKLKQRLVKANLLTNKCYIVDCPTNSMNSWCDKSLTFHLDHKNGDRRDNRLLNLRLLCPNCHSQTESYAGRNSGFANRNKCPKCHKLISKKASFCKSCARKDKTVFDWPPIGELVEEVNRTSINKTAQRIGSSFNALKKHLQKNNIYDQIKKWGKLR